MRRAAFGWIVVASVTFAQGEGRAQNAADARRAQVVARLGTREVKLGDLEDRIAEMPRFQRSAFGDTQQAIARKYLDDVVAPEILLSLGAERDKLDQDKATAYAIERARSSATIRAVRARIGPAAAIPTQDVQKYYDDNRARYDTPERYQIWRILCKTREEAQQVLDAAKKDPTPKEFGDLAREHSLDKATYLRAGNLGFITPDGASNEPGLRADPAVVRAVQGVRDGEFVAAPVPEGDNFAVVWRRGTIAANRRTVDDVAAQIRDTLWKTRVEQETRKLTADLRATHVRDVDDELLVTLELPSDAGASPVRKPPAPSSSP